MAAVRADERDADACRIGADRPPRRCLIAKSFDLDEFAINDRGRRAVSQVMKSYPRVETG